MGKISALANHAGASSTASKHKKQMISIPLTFYPCVPSCKGTRSGNTLTQEPPSYDEYCVNAYPFACYATPPLHKQQQLMQPIVKEAISYELSNGNWDSRMTTISHTMYPILKHLIYTYLVINQRFAITRNKKGVVLRK